MTEELVTLETAKMLKEKGFNWKCEHTISCDNIIRRYDIPQSMSCCTEIDNEPVEFWHYKIFCVNGNTGFRNESRIFYFIHLQNEEDYERKESSSA